MSLLWGLFCLRLGLGLFLSQSGLDKMVAPEQNIDTLSHLLFISVNQSLVIILGAAELVLGLLLILGIAKTITYGAALILQTLQAMANIQAIFMPFGSNHFFIAILPILFAFLALFLMRQHDSKWTLGKRKSLFSS